MKNVEKTRNDIIQAFWDLLEEKGLDKMTVKDISQKAGINRSTFYNYYFDISDLTNQIEEELIQNIQKEAKEFYNNSDEDNINLLSIFFGSVFPKFEDKLFALVCNKGDPSFAKKMQREIIPFISKMGILDADSPNFDYIVTFIFSSALGLISYWYDSGKKISKEEFTNVTYTLISSGFMNMIKK